MNNFSLIFKIFSIYIIFALKYTPSNLKLVMERLKSSILQVLAVSEWKWSSPKFHNIMSKLLFSNQPNFSLWVQGGEKQCSWIISSLFSPGFLQTNCFPIGDTRVINGKETTLKGVSSAEKAASKYLSVTKWKRVNLS